MVFDGAPKRASLLSRVLFKLLILSCFPPPSPVDSSTCVSCESFFLCLCGHALSHGHARPLVSRGGGSRTEGVRRPSTTPTLRQPLVLYMLECQWLFQRTHNLPFPIERSVQQKPRRKLQSGGLVGRFSGGSRGVGPLLLQRCICFSLNHCSAK